MRRRQVRTVREEERPSLLLMAAGAVAGAAAGLYLGRRYRSLDAFLDDMRGRFAGLRDIWLDDELASDDDRVRLRADADLDEENGDDESFDDLAEDELEGTPLGAEGARIDEGDEDVVFDEEEEADEEDVEELEDDLADIASANGVSESSTRAADATRRLEERVLQALSDEPDLGGRAIEIAVVGDGVVELTGSVRTIEEISRASALVRKVPGVNMVLNRIDVRSGGHIDTASVPRNPVEEPVAESGREPNA